MLLTQDPKELRPPARPATNGSAYAPSAGEPGARSLLGRVAFAASAQLASLEPASHGPGRRSMIGASAQAARTASVANPLR